MRAAIFSSPSVNRSACVLEMAASLPAPGIHLEARRLFGDLTGAAIVFIKGKYAQEQASARLFYRAINL